MPLMFANQSDYDLIEEDKIKVNPTYVNAGMLVMDIKNMREQNVEAEFLSSSLTSLTKFSFSLASASYFAGTQFFTNQSKQSPYPLCPPS